MRRTLCSTCGRDHSGAANSFNACEPVVYEETKNMSEDAIMVCEETAYGSTVRLSFGIYIF